MDSSDAGANLEPLMPTAASNSDPVNPTLKRKAEDEKNLDVVPVKKLVFRGPYRPQNFSVPYSLIYYILKNPSSAQVWEKLIKTCKHFFAKNAVVVFPTFDYYYGEWKSFFNGTANCFDLMNITHKIWVADQIIIGLVGSDLLGNVSYNLASSIVPKLYKCDAKYVSLQLQHLSYHDFMMIASNVEDILLEYCSVTHEDDTDVPIEKLVEPLSKVKYFWLDGYLEMTSKSFNELVKLPHFSSIDEFVLCDIPATFDVEAFRDYMKGNKHTKFDLSFCRSHQEYQNRLEALVDEVIVGIAEHNYPHTLIYFNELDEEKYEKMRSVYCGD